MLRGKRKTAGLLLALCLLLSGCGQEARLSFDLSSIPDFDGEPYVVLNDNIPEFEEQEKTTEVFEEYSAKDYLGRCGVAYANVCVETMPVEERGQIGEVRPTGWHTVKYDEVDGKYLYNRCHLIGFQLAGENANDENLITGTRYMNVQGMLVFEDMVADYVEETGNHVLYRVTPVFEEDNLVASGVQIEAESVEDSGKGIQFNVYCYNAQPGIEIDYETGESKEVPETTEGIGEAETTAEEPQAEEQYYIINMNSARFHTPDCSGVADMKEENKQPFYGSREELAASGYSPCGWCRP